MEIPQIPKNPKEWTVDLIYKICKLTDIESEDFDLKLEPNKLYEDICAMANTNNGTIVLGVDEIKEKDRMVEFKPVGFEEGKQDSISNEISNYIASIDPIPKVVMEPIIDETRKVFFMVLRITGNSSDKPYFIKSTDQCFIRIQRSSRRIGRSVILNLFSTISQEKRNLERLLALLLLLNQEIKNTVVKISGYSPGNQTRTARIDLGFVRNAVIENESFLVNHELLGNRTNDTISNGIIPVLHSVETLNEQIKAYNSSYNRDVKAEIKAMITSDSYVLHSELASAESTLDRIIAKIDERLSKFN